MSQTMRYNEGIVSDEVNVDRKEKIETGKWLNKCNYELCIQKAVSVF